jgi:hypothetical protein
MAKKTLITENTGQGLNAGQMAQMSTHINVFT